MNNNELISVIVITYNSEKTVIDTLDSIISQTYTNIEIIVSDDCSVDDTAVIVSAYSQKHKNVYLVPGKKNIGVSANINKGIKHAHGKYVKVIAGDDKLEKEAIEVYWKHYSDNEIMVSDFSIFGCTSEKKTERLREYYYSRLEFYERSTKKQCRMLAQCDPIFSPACGIISVDLFKKVGYYSEEYKYLDDYPFYFKCAQNGVRFTHINDRLVCYRVSDESLSGSFNVKSYSTARSFFFRERFPFLLKKMMFFALIKNLVYFVKNDIRIKHTKKR